MRKQIFIDAPAEFHDLWVRATAGVRVLQLAPQHELVYFDSAIVTTRHFYQFVKDLFRFASVDADSFAFVGLRPDPVGYFFNHFSKFPAIIFQRQIVKPTTARCCKLIQAAALPMHSHLTHWIMWFCRRPATG
jgi:hypothetical protein